MHPRNRHQDRYDFGALRVICPELNQFVALNKYGVESIDFANPEAVRILNKALLKNWYGIQYWEFPPHALCPPIPGRADMIHAVADLISKKQNAHGLDIGVGANCIYPLLGVCEYGWTFVGSDINPASLQSAKKIAENNPQLKGKIQFRHQKNSQNIFKGIIEKEDYFDFTICNPPFHASPEEAELSNQKKWNNLRKKNEHAKQVVNFGGQDAELWCPGGELKFLLTMIQESVFYSNQCAWFTTLVSKEHTLPELFTALRNAKASKWQTIDMAQGQKKSRILAWTFQQQ